jgi:hypothetical protein
MYNLPMKNGGSFHSDVNVYQRATGNVEIDSGVQYFREQVESGEDFMAETG